MKAGMIGDVEFKKAGSETVCCVSLINTTVGQRFLACTLSSSKTFKTFKGAEKFMNSFESRDKNAINALIEQKEIALEEAINNAEWYASIGLDEMADNEVARQEKLIRDIKKLKAAI